MSSLVAKSTQHSATVTKVVNVVKALRKLPESEYEEDECLEYLKKIDASYNEAKSARVEIAKALLEHKYPEVALKCLKFYTRRNLFEHEQTWPCSFYLLRSVWNYSDANGEIALACADFLPILLDFLSNELLLPSDEEDEKLFKLTLNIMNNIARQPETKVLFQQYQASKTLRNISNIENEHLKVLVYLILAQIVNENELSGEVSPCGDVVESLCGYVKEALRKEQRHKGITVSEYLSAIGKLALCKDNRSKLISNGLLSVLRGVLNNTATTSSHHFDAQREALSCLWNLSFDEKISETIKRDKELMTLITNAKTSVSAGILFTLNDLPKKKPINKVVDTSKPKVMVSFHPSSRDLCVKLRDELQVKGYQVILETEMNLTATTDAVESAAIFLMCACERYYQSACNRLEAEYALRLKKPIIPLIMQANYAPLGWLGTIIGGKVYYTFCGARKSIFEQSLTTLLKEMQRLIAGEESNKLGKLSKAVSKLTPATLDATDSGHKLLATPSNERKKATTTMSTPVTDWSTKEVTQWLTSLNLSPWIVDSESFHNVNGRMLAQLYDMKKSAPDFFYRLLQTKLTPHDVSKAKSDNVTSSSPFHLSDLLKLASELNNLFPDN